MTIEQVHAKAASLLKTAFPDNAIEVMEKILALDNAQVLPVI
ncbi:hypothetical protein SDC9_209128 [bioreactor metagenome]|uniref:Uncharacterized protein n=1 Tax=bioreactor metagenome TaxID=1076179 RepID=A0A645JCK4_9ZZZZ